VYPVSFCKSVHNNFPLNNIEHVALDMQTKLDIRLHVKCLLKLCDVNKNFNGKIIFHSQVGIRVFNSLPSQIKELCSNRNQFKRALKNFLYFLSFYTLDEYFSYNKT